nr:RNA-directed DNA polymerase, eukaryota [Tanacetum cinerariifolium]
MLSNLYSTLNGDGCSMTLSLCYHVGSIPLGSSSNLLRETLYDYGPIPFRFYHYWLKADGFDKFVIDSWNEAPEDDNNAIRKFLYKLKFLKSNIRRWYNVYRNNKNGAAVKLKEDLRFMDEEIDKGNGSVEIVNKRLEVLNKLQHVVNAQASEVAQKAKIKWYVEGDENVKFFHGMLNKKRSQLNIRGVMKNGTWTDNPDTVKQEFFHHFKNRFEKPSNQRARIDMSFPNVLSIDQREDLERMVSKDEVKKAVWDCGKDKSPGPDGFTFGFYRHFWSTIECDVFEAVKHFFTHGDIPNGCNSIFIALIPKILDANVVKDFRPISLIGSIYNIIAKILTNRLVDVLGNIVNEVQSAFITERQILDGPFILNEVMQWCRIKKKQVLIFKVDFEKAYDSVRWDLLDDVLYKFDFGNKWRVWIQSCLKSSRGSILINGSPTEEFQFYRGLKQCDPLSLFLFIFIMESLHLSFQRVVDSRFFTGISLNSMVNLSHLFFADDAIFLGQRIESNIDTLVHVLECYHRASGLQINMCKSKILGIHVEDGKIKNAASKLGCLILNTPFSILGTKVGANMSRVYAWKEVVDKVTSRLLRWKMKTEVKQMQNQGVNFFEYIRLKLGNGDNTLFWEDKWCEGGVLKDLFPPLYALELMRKSTVSVKLSESSLENSFRRKVRSGVEEAQLGDLYELISAVTLTPSIDRYVWSLENSGEFSVASIRKIIDGKRFQDVTSLTWWVKSVPIKVNIIGWKIKIDALPTRYNISRRGIKIDSIACPICKGGVETTSHLFFQCRLVRPSSNLYLKASSMACGGRYGISATNSYSRRRLLLDQYNPNHLHGFNHSGLLDLGGGIGTEKKSNVTGMSGSSVDSGFPLLSQVFGTTRGGLIEGNTVTVGSASQVAKVNVVSSDTPNATSDLGNDSIPIEVGHESAMKKTHTSYANKLSPMSLTNVNLCKLDASCQMMLIMTFGYLWFRFMSRVMVRMKQLGEIWPKGNNADKRLFFFFKFSSTEGVDLVLRDDPWMIRGPGYTKETIRVEYECEPPRYSMCLLFAHSVDDYPKDHKRVVNRVENGKGESFEANDEGFIEVKKKKSDASPKKASLAGKSSKQIDMTNATTLGNGIFSLSNSFEALNNDDPVTMKVESGTKASTYGVQEEDDKPIEKVDYLGDHGSEDEVEPDDNEMTNFLLSKPSRVGYGVLFMASGDNDRDVEDALSKLLQMGSRIMLEDVLYPDTIRKGRIKEVVTSEL